ncbi:MAG: cytochrome-c peroxidase [Deltaproteobacteria bacterium CG11_big_fil_rev_8_21_14_0_20_47_16]|nr:MAG: cytochrome-c peroxidase [Deltaproteobacteria bacterium CG11_big_fil_rev_8_21_14_0_20_47_16]
MQLFKTFLVVVVVSEILSCSKTPPPTEALQPSTINITHAKEAPFLDVPLGLTHDNLNIPKTSTLTQNEVELGRILYFDPRLSADGTVSCATCHKPEEGWGEHEAVSTGIRGQKGVRNAPTVVNSTFMGSQFWDGRAASLEEQALGPLVNPIEMGNKTVKDVVTRIKTIQGYLPYFEKTFHQGPTEENLARAIAAFERTVLSANSRYDQYLKGDQSALNPAEVRGLAVFMGKGRCVLCHVGPTFSDSQFHNIGVGMAAEKPDMGRHVVTKKKEDVGAFKTPGLRDLLKTSPYMHDGSQLTLEEVVEFYDKGGEPNDHLDPRITPLHLTAEEKADLVQFMKALEGNPYPFVKAPELPQ